MDRQWPHRARWPQSIFGRVAGGELRSLWPVWCTTARHGNGNENYQKKGKDIEFSFDWQSSLPLPYRASLAMVSMIKVWSVIRLDFKKIKHQKWLLRFVQCYSPSWHGRNSLRIKSSTAPQILGRTWPFEYLQHHNITSVAAAGCSTVPTVKVGLAIQFLSKTTEKIRASQTNKFPERH